MHDNIEPYLMKERKCYSFTFNPPPRKKHVGVNYEELSDVSYLYSQLAKALNGAHYVDYYMFLEASKTGKLHLHGYIRVNDMYLWCLKGLKQLCENGTTSIREITCPHIWYKYATKSLHIFLGKMTLKPYVKHKLSIKDVKPPDYVEWYGNTTYKCSCKTSVKEYLSGT